MIAITGASGHLGRATIHFLMKKVSPSNIVAIVRNPESVGDLNEKGIIVRQADYCDYKSLEGAFAGISSALQISTVGVDVNTAKQHEKNVVDAMVKNRLRRIVYTSMVKTRPNAIFQGTEAHYNTEKLIKDTSIPYTFFRNNMYFEAIPHLIGDALDSNKILYPSGEGRVSFVSRKDIAEAIATVLTEVTHPNKTYEITGSQAFTFDELAKQINPRMKHSNIPEIQYKKILQSYKLSDPVVDLLLSMARGIKAGEFSHTSNDLESILGRKRLSLSEYIKTLKYVV